MDTAPHVTTDAQFDDALDGVLVDTFTDGQQFRVRFEDGYATFTPEHDYDAFQNVKVCLWSVEWAGRGGATNGNLGLANEPNEIDRAVDALKALLGPVREIR